MTRKKMGYPTQRVTSSLYIKGGKNNTNNFPFLLLKVHTLRTIHRLRRRNSTIGSWRNQSRMILRCTPKPPRFLYHGSLRTIWPGLSCIIVVAIFSNRWSVIGKVSPKSNLEQMLRLYALQDSSLILLGLLDFLIISATLFGLLEHDEKSECFR